MTTTTRPTDLVPVATAPAASRRRGGPRRAGRAPLRIGLLTTIDTNIGDDLIREGILQLLHAAWPGQPMEFVIVNKHRPAEVYPPWHPVRLADRLPRGRLPAGRVARRLTWRLGQSRFDACDLVVQCGTPVLWPGCHRSEWAAPVWEEVLGRIHGRVPVLNLAAGSCFPWERQPVGPWDGADARFVRAMLSSSTITTARDRLAARLYASFGASAPLLPCAAMLAGRGQGGRHEVGGGRRRPRLLVSYMPGGGHYDWDQGIDAGAWRLSVETLLRHAVPRMDVAFLCHSTSECREAAALDPSIPQLLPTTPAAYLAAVRDADVAVCNRLHASVALAGLGIPSIAVGTDTRLLMVEALGLPTQFVKSATSEWLVDQLDGMLQRRGVERERLLALREQAWDGYGRVLRMVR